MRECRGRSDVLTYMGTVESFKLDSWSTEPSREPVAILCVLRIATCYIASVVVIARPEAVQIAPDAAKARTFIGRRVWR